MKIFEEVTLIFISFRSKKKIENIINKISEKLKIIIIDNSLDYELKKKIENFQNIKIYLKDNIGYGAGANFAKKKINTKYFLLCNPDLEDIDDEKINKFYNIAEQLFPNFLALGPNYKPPQKKTLNLIRQTKINGSCMFVNSSVFDELGGFDENIFLYFEEDDLCKRGNKIKKFSYKVNDINIFHDIGTSVENKTIEDKQKLKELTLWHFIWSKYYFYQKHYGKLVSIVLFLPTLIRILFKLSYTKIIKDNDNYKKYKIRFSGLINSILGKKSYKRLD